MNTQMPKNFLSNFFGSDRRVFNNKLTSVVVFVVVFSVVLFKLTSEPYIFDPTFGVQKDYGFIVSDAKVPFTVYYVAEGVEFVTADGDFGLANQTIQIEGGNDTTAEWVFDTRAYLTLLRQYGGYVNEAALLITTADPMSSRNETYVSIYVNDALVIHESLSTPKEDDYTWNVTTQWDIPGSNFGYPYVFAFFTVPPSALFSESDVQQTRVRVATTQGTHWNIDYVSLKLYSDPYSLSRPWWQQNFSLLFATYASVILVFSAATILCFELRRKSVQLPVVDTIRGWILRNRAILLYSTVGLLFRLALMIMVPLGSGDQFTYRFISLASYYYGVDTRSLYGMYGTVWHGLLLFTYPLSLFMSSLISSVSFDYVILKLPVVVSDILIAYFLYRIGVKLAGQRVGRILSLFWLFNPYVLWLSAIWGTHHIVPTMLTVLAVERILYKRYRTGAVALAGAIFSGPNNIFLLPVILVLIHKGVGKQKLFEFFTFFALGCSIFALPWKFSISIFFNTYAGAGRAGFPTLSYSYFIIPPEVAGVWSIASELIGLGFLCAYMAKTKMTQVSQINVYVLAAFLIFYLSNTLVFPTYALWSLPYLIFVYISGRKVPFSYLATFMSFPLLWIMYWTPPLLPQFLQAPGTEVFRDTFGLNFSFVCMLIMLKLGFSRNVSTTTQFKPKSARRLHLNAVVISTLVIIVFAQWIKEPIWLDLWDQILKPISFALSVSLVLLTILFGRTRKTSNGEMTSSSNRISKDMYAAMASLTVAWLYNLLILASSQMVPFLLNQPSILMNSQDDLFFSVIMLVWLPLIAYSVLKNRSLFLVPWILLIQIDFIITRHYSTYIVVNRILNVYVATHMLTLIIDVITLTLMLSFLLATALYSSKRPRQQQDLNLQS